MLRSIEDSGLDLSIGGFGGGAEGAVALLFFLYFQNVFETLTLLYFALQICPQCHMLHVLKTEVFIRDGGGEDTTSSC